jgi:spectinomycin phosphotransferase
VQDRPEDVDQDELARLLASRWQLPVGSAGGQGGSSPPANTAISPAGTSSRLAKFRYLQVGFGDHHWELTDGAGQRWFVTVVDFDGGWRGTGRADGLADLIAAMRTSSVLASHGLDFVLAPQPTADGAEVASLDDRFAVTMFPFLDGQAGRYDDAATLAERLDLVSKLAALHTATAQVAHLAPRRDSVPASRAQLDAAMSQLGSPWSGGPHSEPCRLLLAAHEPRIRLVLARFDRLVGSVRGSGAPLVITHGEPHQANILTAADRTWLIDWDTVGLAPAERDLWRFGQHECAEFQRYAELTGHPVSSAAIELYRLRWQIDDLALFTGAIRAEHERTADTDVAWAAVNEIIEDFER